MTKEYIKLRHGDDVTMKLSCLVQGYSTRRDRVSSYT